MSSNESQIFSLALQRLHSPFNSNKDVVNFLHEFSHQKSNSTRFLSYLVIFKVLPVNDFRSLQALHQSFQSLLQTHFTKSLSRPLENLPESSAFVIEADINRGDALIKNVSQDLNLPPLFSENIKESSYKILSLLDLTNFQYLQGFDRYFYLIFALAFIFTQENNFPYSLSESLTYHLLLKILSLANLTYFTQNTDKCIERFFKIDQKLKLLNPQMYQALRSGGFSSFHFALKWELIFYSEEHLPSQLFSLWDRLFLHQRDFDSYKQDIDLAHILQIPIEGILIETIQRFKNYDVAQILLKADEIHESFVQQHWKILLATGLSVAVIIAVAAIYS